MQQLFADGCLSKYSDTTMMNTSIPASSTKLVGEVNWYDHRGGYGLIKGNDGNSYFIHFSNQINKNRTLVRGETVSFNTRKRQFKEGMEAFNLDLVNSSDNCIAIGEEGTEMHFWNIWPDAKSLYPELEAPFNLIASRLDLMTTTVEQSTLERAFREDIPIGAVPKCYDRHSDVEKRRGAFVGYKCEDILLIVHAFYKSKRRDMLCWRARIIKKGKVVQMPRKALSCGTSKVHIWCENFEGCFLWDIQKMIDRARDNFS